MKKLSDAQFCSAEHRQNFYDDQQRLMLQRLQVSASRLQRFRRGAPSATVAKAISEEAMAPAAIAKFCMQQPPDPLARPFALLMLPAFEVSNSQVDIPHWTSSLAVAGAKLASAVFDIPWPKYNPGLLFFSAFDTSAAMFDEIVAGLFRTTSIRNWQGLSASRLVPVRRPRPLNSPLRRVYSEIQATWETAVSTPDLERPRLGGLVLASGIRLPKLQGVRSSFPVFANRPALRPVIGELDLLVVEAAIGWSSLRLDPNLRRHSLAFLDRVFRMRPRSGVPGKNLSTFLGIEPQTENYPAATPSRSPIRLVAAGIVGEPSRTEKYFRARPRGPVDVARAAYQSSSDPTTFPARPTVVGFTGAAVATVGLSAEVASSTVTTAAFTGPSYYGIPLLAAGSTTETVRPAIELKPVQRDPLPSSRVFRGRPRGPLAASNLAAFIPIAGVVAAASETSPMLTPASRAASLQLIALEPTLVERLFRMRPRSGVTDLRITASVASGDFEALCSRPVFPATAFAGDVAPVLVQKLVRGRPRGPVAAFVKASEVIDARMAQIGVPASLVVGRVANLQTEREPRPSERVFRAKPRGPVNASVSEFEMVAPGTAAVSMSSPAMTSRDTVIAERVPALVSRMYRFRPPQGGAARKMANQTGIAEPGPTSDLLPPAIEGVLRVNIQSVRCEPAAVAKFYRSRTRGPAFRPDLAVFEAIASGGDIGLVSQSAYPCYTPVAANLAPDVSSRLFRMRPRAGVTSPDVALLETIAPVSYSVALSAACPITPKPALPFLSVRATDRFFRMRPKAGVSGAAESLGIACRSEVFAATPIIIYAPAADCAPLQCHRMVRPRPRGAVDGGTSATSSINSNSLHIDIELTRGAYPLGCGVIPAPAFLNRVYRTRPRAPLTDVETMMATIRFKHVPTPDPDALFPTLPCDILEDPAPALLDKLYRMRPRAGKPGAAEKLPIGCEPMMTDGPDTLVRPFPLNEPPGLAAKDALRSFSRHWRTVPVDFSAMVM